MNHVLVKTGFRLSLKKLICIRLKLRMVSKKKIKGGSKFVRNIKRLVDLNESIEKLIE